MAWSAHILPGEPAAGEREGVGEDEEGGYKIPQQQCHASHEGHVACTGRGREKGRGGGDGGNGSDPGAYLLLASAAATAAAGRNDAKVAAAAAAAASRNEAAAAAASYAPAGYPDAQADAAPRISPRGLGQVGASMPVVLPVQTIVSFPYFPQFVSKLVA